MFNDYEIIMLSKLKQEEMEDLAKNRQLFSSIQDKKTTLKAQVITNPIESTPCCEPACS